MIRRLVVPAVSTAIMLAVLIGLGTWQWRRLGEKTALLQQIDAAEHAPAIPFAVDLPPFAKVVAVGRFRPAATALYGAEGRDSFAATAMGAHQIALLERDGAAPIVVDRGWVPEASPPALPDGSVRVEGWLRPGERAGALSAPDDVARHRFFTLDPLAIAASLGVTGVADVTLVALGPQTGALPDPGHTLPRPPNNHLSYVFTWYGLACVLAVIFLVYLRKALRS